MIIRNHGYRFSLMRYSSLARKSWKWGERKERGNKDREPGRGQSLSLSFFSSYSQVFNFRFKKLGRPLRNAASAEIIITEIKLGNRGKFEPCNIVSSWTRSDLGLLSWEFVKFVANFELLSRETTIWANSFNFHRFETIFMFCWRGLTDFADFAYIVEFCFCQI